MIIIKQCRNRNYKLYSFLNVYKFAFKTDRFTEKVSNRVIYYQPMDIKSLNE